VANWVMIGLLLVITHQVRQPSVEPLANPIASLAGEATQLIPVTAGARASATEDETGPLPLFMDAPTGPIPSVAPDAPTGPLPAVTPDALTRPIPSVATTPSADDEATTAIPSQDGGPR